MKTISIRFQKTLFKQLCSYFFAKLNCKYVVFDPITFITYLSFIGFVAYNSKENLDSDVDLDVDGDDTLEYGKTQYPFLLSILIVQHLICPEK